MPVGPPGGVRSNEAFGQIMALWTVLLYHISREYSAQHIQDLMEYMEGAKGSMTFKDMPSSKGAFDMDIDMALKVLNDVVVAKKQEAEMEAAP